MASPAPLIRQKLDRMKAERAQSLEDEEALLRERAAIERLLPRLLIGIAESNERHKALVTESEVYEQAIKEMDAHFSQVAEIRSPNASTARGTRNRAASVKSNPPLDASVSTLPSWIDHGASPGRRRARARSVRRARRDA